MERDGRIFLPQVREMYDQAISEYTMPTFHNPRMTSSEANTFTWEEFKDRLQPLSVVRPEVDGLEFIVTPKYVGWGIEDVNIFAGHEGRAVNEISDLSTVEGANFFGLNLLIAREIVQECAVESAQVSIGFNTEDFSMGHHSLVRLHSHIRAIRPTDSTGRNTSTNWKSLERFEKLGLIEPFSPLYHDYMLHLIKDGLFADHIAKPPIHNVGYTSMELTRGPESPDVFSELSKLFVAFRKEYETVSDILTNGKRDPVLDRYIPRSPTERKALLGSFLLAREGVYSEDSQYLLSILRQTYMMPNRVMITTLGICLHQGRSI